MGHEVKLVSQDLFPHCHHHLKVFQELCEETIVGGTVCFRYRTRKGYKTGCFGVLAAVEKEGTIQIGDEVYAMLDDSLSISK